MRGHAAAAGQHPWTRCMMQVAMIWSRPTCWGPTGSLGTLRHTPCCHLLRGRQRPAHPASSPGDQLLKMEHASCQLSMNGQLAWLETNPGERQRNAMKGMEGFTSLENIGFRRVNQRSPATGLLRHLASPWCIVCLRSSMHRPGPCMRCQHDEPSVSAATHRRRCHLRHSA